MTASNSPQPPRSHTNASIINKRPSVASVLSIIALFAALGGTSYAAATISGKQVKNGTLTGADIKNNSVGGADVKESKLGQVPSAAKATQATNADQATRPRRRPPPTRPPPCPDNSITGAKVADRSLGAADVALANGSPTVDLPSIPANDCAYAVVPAGQNLAGTTVSVSARDGAAFSNGGLSLHAAKSNIQTSFRLVACNMTGVAINPAAAEFDYTAIK